jgi:type II pantothenate kinase
MGTGTAIIGVHGDEIRHICGTGVGGGTVLGLSRQLFGSHSFKHVLELAAGGDISKIDLSIGDIAKDPVSNMTARTTASNYGKVSDDATHADLALGVLNLVFQTVGIFAMMAARAQGTDKVVLTGNLSRAEVGGVREIWHGLEELYDVRYIIPENSDFATAIGAALFGLSS